MQYPASAPALLHNRAAVVRLLDPLFEVLGHVPAEQMQRGQEVLLSSRVDLPASGKIQTPQYTPSRTCHG